MAAHAQNPSLIISGHDTSRRPIYTSVPFLGFTPDARAGSWGDIGVASKPDVNAVHWNNAKIAFLEDRSGVALSYTPWLAQLVDDMYILYFTGYRRIADLQAVAVSMRYFSLGNVLLRDDVGTDSGTFSPRDFAVDVTYSRKLSLNIGIGVTARYINSNLSRSYSLNQGGNAAHGVAVDLGFFYTSNEMRLGATPMRISTGFHMSNLGSKMSYSGSQKNFLPSNMRIGTVAHFSLDPFNTLSLGLDLNKLLVPTPPIYQRGDDGSLLTDANGNFLIEQGRDPDRISGLGAIFSSFFDAPDGLIEEIKEINLAFGMTYWYQNFFSLQAGYHHESQLKGDRRYFTMGAGFRYSFIGVDFAYLLPVAKRNPLANTLRFTLLFALKGKATDTTPSESDALDTLQ